MSAAVASGMILLADIGDLKTVALFVFLGIWLFVAIKLLFTRKEQYEAVARIPLDDQRVMESRMNDDRGREDV